MDITVGMALCNPFWMSLCNFFLDINVGMAL